MRTDLLDFYVGARVKMLRKVAGYDLVAFAAALDVSPATLDLAERGASRWSPELLTSAAEVLGSSVAFFFDGAPETCRHS